MTDRETCLGGETEGFDKYKCVSAHRKCCQCLCKNGNRCQNEYYVKIDTKKFGYFGSTFENYVESEIRLIPQRVRRDCCRICLHHLYKAVKNAVRRYIQNYMQYEYVSGWAYIRYLLYQAGVDPSAISLYESGVSYGHVGETALQNITTHIINLIHG